MFAMAYDIRYVSTANATGNVKPPATTLDTAKSLPFMHFYDACRSVLKEYALIAWVE